MVTATITLEEKKRFRLNKMNKMNKIIGQPLETYLVKDEKPELLLKAKGELGPFSRLICW